MTAPDWDALCASAQAHIGAVIRQPLGPVRAAQFQRFAVAAGDTAERYFDDGAARAQGLPGAVAPPLYLSAVLGWAAGPDEASLRPDGTAGAEVAGVPLPGLRLMGAGQDVEFLRPVTDGCEVTLEVSVADVQLKQGKSGPLLMLTLLRRYLDASGRELVRCRESFIGR